MEKYQIIIKSNISVVLFTVHVDLSAFFCVCIIGSIGAIVGVIVFIPQCVCVYFLV